MDPDRIHRQQQQRWRRAVGGPGAAGHAGLTGNNSSFNGSLRVELAGTLEARAQSLPPSVINNGLVLFNQPDNGTYAGTIGGGTGHVAKSGAGILTLSGANTYGGQTYIDGGSIAVGPTTRWATVTAKCC